MIAKSILLTIFYLLLFNVIIYRFKNLQFRNFKPFITHLLFNVKFVVGIFIWFIYTFYYKDIQHNDVHKFYSDALILCSVASESPKDFVQLITGIGKEDHLDKYYSQMKNWDRNFDEAPVNENRTIIRLNALLMFLSFKTYFVHILFMCFFSLIGWILLTNSIFSFAGVCNSLLAIPVLLLPSVLFWISGVMKEPLLVFGLGLFIYGILNQSSFRNIILTIMGLFIILLTKFFVLACLFPAVVAFLLFKNRESVPFILLKYLGVNALMLFIALNIQYVLPSINLKQMLVNKQIHSVKEADYFQAGSRVHIPELTANTMSILKAAPVGIWNTLNRPYLWEAKNIMMMASSAENLFIIPFIALCICFTRWKNTENLNLFLFLLNCTIAYFALIGMCTPVLGNLVRYKTSLLPLLLFAFAIRINPKTIAGSLNFVLRKGE